MKLSRKTTEIIAVSFIALLIALMFICEMKGILYYKADFNKDIYQSLFEAQAGFSVLGLSIVSLLIGIVDNKKYGMSISNYVMRLNHIIMLNYDILIAETIMLNVFSLVALVLGYYYLMIFLFLVTILACLFLVYDATQTLYRKDKIAEEIHDYILKTANEQDIDNLYGEIKDSIISGDTLVYEDAIDLAALLFDKIFGKQSNESIEKIQKRINTIVNVAVNHPNDNVCYKVAELYISALKSANLENNKLPENERILLDSLDYSRCLSMMLMASTEVFITVTAREKNITIVSHYSLTAENYYMNNQSAGKANSFLNYISMNKEKLSIDYYKITNKIIKIYRVNFLNKYSISEYDYILLCRNLIINNDSKLLNNLFSEWFSLINLSHYLPSYTEDKKSLINFPNLTVIYCIYSCVAFRNTFKEISDEHYNQLKETCIWLKDYFSTMLHETHYGVNDLDIYDYLSSHTKDMIELKAENLDLFVIFIITSIKRFGLKADISFNDIIKHNFNNYNQISLLFDRFKNRGMLDKFKEFNNIFNFPYDDKLSCDIYDDMFKSLQEVYEEFADSVNFR